jgi:uncharacterized protein YkwD
LLAGLLLGLGLALPALGTAHAEEGTPSTTPPLEVQAVLASPDLDLQSRMQLEVLTLVNQRRAAAGLHPLQLDARLLASANEHSADMANHRFCRHGGSDGSSARGRIRKHGYEHNNWSGENIVCGKSSAEAAMGWWMNSGPHRRNILHAHYTHIGIGFAPNGPWGPMWTLNFGAGEDETVVPQVLLPPPAPDAPPEAPASE